MANKVSKEFKNAMNGVLNGEEWRRECWTYVDDTHFYRVRSNPKSEDIGGYWYSRERCEQSNFYANPVHTSLEDMTATDWVKVQ